MVSPKAGRKDPLKEFQQDVVVAPYDPTWSGRFDAEARHLKAALGTVVVDVQHVGSTSVPGLSAKPTIDILLVVTDLAALDDHGAAMISLGYEPKGELFIPNSRFFVKQHDGSHSHHIHSYPPGHPEIQRHLDLRDFLRCHAAEAARYADLKTRLAREHHDDIRGYSKGKTPYIAALLARARRWREAGA